MGYIKMIAQRPEKLYRFADTTLCHPARTPAIFPNGVEKGHITIFIHLVNAKRAWQNTFPTTAHHNKLTRPGFPSYFGSPQPDNTATQHGSTVRAFYTRQNLTVINDFG